MTILNFIETTAGEIEVEARDICRASLVESLRLRYQPIIRLADMVADSVEVLARAAQSNGALSGPEQIVEAMSGPAESLDLTGAVLHRALTEIQEEGLVGTSLGFAFNLPLDAMLHPGLLGMVETMQAGFAIPAQNIRFELTERHRVDDINEVAVIIENLRRAGHVLALDDVTPDMPNLAELLTLPVHAVKLDRSVVTDNAKAGQAFIAAIVAGAVRHGQEIIAEGIETDKILTRMRRLGVTHGQGFLFAHPLPVEGLAEFLKKTK